MTTSPSAANPTEPRTEAPGSVGSVKPASSSLSSPALRAGQTGEAEPTIRLLIEESDALRARLVEVQNELWAAQERVAALQWSADELVRLRRTKLFRYASPLRSIYAKILRRQREASLASPEQRARSYAAWVAKYDTLDSADRQGILGHIASMDDPPLISVIMPVYNTSEPFLRRAIESVRAQLYPNWELCIADDASEAPHVKNVIEEHASQDDRIKVVYRSVNGHIAAATNSALELATGAYVTFLDHDDELTEHALYLVAYELLTHPDAAFVYTDEDRIDASGRRHEPHFKPDWNPDRLRSLNYVNHLSVYPMETIKRLCGMRTGFDGSQDYDLLLRATELADPALIRHIPFVCYHWRAVAGEEGPRVSELSYAHAAGRRAIREHLERLHRDAEVEPAWEGSLWHRVRYRLPEHPPAVTVIIPTRDGRLLDRCLSSVINATSYPNFEILVVDNGSEQRSTLNLLEGFKQKGLIRVMRDDRPFNYSALNNEAVASSSAELVLLLNDDTEVISPDWLTEMVGQAIQPGVGAVGAKLYYPDGHIQHAGVILGAGGVAGHIHPYSQQDSVDYLGRIRLVQDLSAVTGACMLIRRAVFEEVGGLDDQELAVAFNDIDLCMKIRKAGYWVVWTPFAELYHHESVSRGYDEDDADRFARFQKEVIAMKRRWGPALLTDPAYNPNLSLASADFTLAFPPRVTYPWQLVRPTKILDGAILDDASVPASRQPRKPA